MGRLVFGYKTDDSRIFAYIAQNRERAGRTDVLASILCDFTSRQRRRMRHKANRHKDTVGYPELEERWQRLREIRRRQRNPTAVPDRPPLSRTKDIKTLSGGEYLG